ncbi:hypothetical protein G1H11_18675 [Phytoactinopolyspora alkaliphila]|uniref:Uncharacterized protein n=2 Tax=Phytoactinopolyspora alkaliphila TaxID=1783498 RepID=A0A6N9YQW2_9ACTN|nr:hypothetical protein [Phytoactinopolyspora alkaliphila]
MFPGVFALANGLAHAGALSPDDYAWWRAANDHGDAAYTDPSTVDPACFDRELNPGAVSWFKSTATSLISTCDGYLALLDRYGVPWTELRTDHPGMIVYEDDVQVVATPYSYPEHWRMSDGRSRVSPG